MRHTLLILSPIILLGFQGCKDEGNSPDLTKGFTVKSQTVIDNNWARIERLIIEAQGHRSISLCENADGLGILPDSPDGKFTSEVILMAIMSPASHQFTWFVTVYKLEGDRRVSGGSGSPRTFMVKQEERSHSELVVRKIVQLRDISGYHEYGKVVSLGHFLTEIRHAPELVLVVK